MVAEKKIRNDNKSDSLKIDCNNKSKSQNENQIMISEKPHKVFSNPILPKKKSLEGNFGKKYSVSK